MSKRILAVAATFTAGLLFLAAAGFDHLPLKFPAVRGEQVQGKDETGDDHFGSTKVWAVHFDMAAKEYEAMQPPKGFGFGGPGAPGQSPKDKAPVGRPSEKNLFGQEFPWAEADFAAEGKTLKKVGLRYAGDGAYFAAAANLRRPLRVEFSRFDKFDFHGHKSINLHAAAQDPSRGREALAYAVFRAVGVPAPRTAFAEVTLSVPGKYDKEYVGLYTVVEDVDQKFMADRFPTKTPSPPAGEGGVRGNGLLMRPVRMRGVDFLGEEWDKYKGQYQPQAEPTKEQAKRVIDFAKLVNQGTDEQFRKEVGAFLDVDQFLRFMAANALLSNLDGFLAQGSNYHLYLNPDSNKFIFIPGDLEQSLANMAFMGTPDQQIDLSLMHPYPGENKLVDRLLASKEISDQYRKILKDLSATIFTKEWLLKEVDAIDKTTKELVAKDSKASAARKEGKGVFGAPGGKGATAPDLRTFIEKRIGSVVAQLDGKSKGYIPQQFGFGQPPGGGFPGAKAVPVNVDDKYVQDTVKAPPELEVTLFAAPPMVGYPVTVAAAPTGEVFVAVDEQGELGRTPGGGKVLRLVDTKGTGKADQVTVFAKMEHPRGLVYQNGSLWVMHPPTLSVYHDDDGDGVADRHEVLVTGLTTNQIDLRGGDHTTNGIRMGLDGWIYIAVGDYGILEAKGKDGAKVTLRGGGILRVRPDGTELEIYLTGVRNPFDLAMDPYMNMFTRDNDNNGPGWDIRVSHLIQSAHYGYTQLYANFPDEIMPPLGQFGGGGGTAGLFLESPLWPQKYRDTLFTGDWGRSEVYKHALKPHGATFDLQQEVFLKIPRPTGMDMDGSGRLYLCSWRGGESGFYTGPNVGFIVRITPAGLKPAPFPNLKEATLAELVRNLAEPNAVLRLNSQREILRRGRGAVAHAALFSLASQSNAPLSGRAAAIFTLKQLFGIESGADLLKLAGDNAVREFALRALTDRKGEMDLLDFKPFVDALTDANPRVQAQALISLGRLGNASAAKNIIPLTARPNGSVMPTKKPVHAQPDADRVVPHLAVRALVSLNASDACLKALDGPYYEGALWAMRYMHDRKTVEGLIKKLGTTRATELRLAILQTLIRLYYREAEYKGEWWGIRPDNAGPYWDRKEWEMSKRIGTVLSSAALDGDAQTLAFLQVELPRHKVTVAELPIGKGAAPRPEKEPETPVTLMKADPNNPDQIGNLAYEAAAKRTLEAKGNADQGKALFKTQSCSACHTDADGQSPKGPHLVDIGARASASELVESILKPSAKIAQGFETVTFVLADGRVFSGFIVTESAKAVQLRDGKGIQVELKREDIESRQVQTQSAMPEGVVSNLTPAQLADLLAYLQSLK